MTRHNDPDPWDALGSGPGTAVADPLAQQAPPDPWDALFGTPAYTPAPTSPDPEMGLGERLARPFRGFVHGIKKGGGAVVPELAGNVLEQFGAEGVGGRMEAAAEARGERFAEEWDSPGFREAPVTWLAENLGAALPTSVPSILGGTAGAMLAGPWGAAAGAALPGWLMGVGDIRGELEDAGMEEGAAMDALVLGGAVPYAAADVLMPARLGKSLASGAAPGGLGPLLKGALRGGAEETFAEGTQSLVSQGAAAIGTGAPIDVGRIGEEAIRGGAAGIFLGGGGQAVADRLPERTAPPLLSRAIETAKEIAARGTEAAPAPAPEAGRIEAPQQTPAAPAGSTDPWDTLPDTPQAPEAVEGEIGARETIPLPGETTAPIPETAAALDETMGPTPETPTWSRERLVDEAPETIDPKRRQRSIFPGDDRKVETVYTVVEADRLKASHTPGYGQRSTEEYPAEIQGRAYHGRRGRQGREHTEEMVSNFDTERALDRTVSVAEGPAVVTPSGVVVAGNGRIIAQQRLYEGLGGEQLKTALQEQAGDFGIDPAQVAGMQSPVLVRSIVDPEVDVTNVDQLRELNASSDQPIGKTKDPLSEAATKAVQFREAQGALEHFAATAEPDATIRSYLGGKAGHDFLTALVDDGVISKGERARFMDANTGMATDEGRTLVERMFYVAALGDPEVVSRAPPTILNKLDTSLPAIIRADRIGGDWEIGPLVSESLDLLAAARAGDMSLDDVVAQVDIERTPPSEHVVEMARFLEQRKGNVRDAFRTYANQAEAFTRQSASEDMFGHEPTGAEDSRQIFGKAALAPRRMSPQQARRQLLEAVQQPLFEEEISTAGRRPRPTVDDPKYRELKGKKRIDAHTADLAEWEGGTLTNLPQGSEYAPSASEGPQGDIFQEQQNIFALAPESAGETRPKMIFGHREQEARQEWDELGREFEVTGEQAATRDRAFEGIQKDRKKNRHKFTEEELEEARQQPNKTAYDIVEVKAGRARRKGLPQDTFEIDTPERLTLRRKIADRMYNTAIEKRKRDRKAFIILGPPGAGKSTAVANQLLSEHGALEVDSDIAKARLPEYADGINAQGVHVESREIVDRLVLPQAIAAGDNVVIPKVGSQGVGGSSEDLLNTLKDAGYSIELILVDLDPQLAAGRTVARYLNTGRFVDPHYVLGTVGTRPQETYAALRSHEAVARFRWLDQDVQHGQPPNVIEEGSNAEGPSRFLVPEGTEGEGLSGPRIFGDRGSRSDGGRGDEASEGGAGSPPPGVHPLAPTAQLSEQLPSAGKFTEGTATEAPKSIAIVRDLQKVLHQALQGVKVTEGKIPKRGMFARALAVVDPRAQVVRSVSLSDVPAIGHEYGHLMQKLLFGATTKGGIDNAQLATLPGAVRGELEDLAQGISNESITEGWAEFWRRYLDNPSALDAEASNALEHIEELLEQHPAARNAWQDARERWKLHRDASPQARLRSHISVGEGDPEALSIEGKWMRFRTNVLDNFEAIHEVVEHVRQRTGDELTLEEDAETLARLSRGASGIGDMFVGEKVGDNFIGGTVEFGTLARSGKSLTEILDPVQDHLDDFRDYMVARRAQELHGRDLATGIRNEDVEWTVKTLEARHGETFKPAFDDLQEMNGALLRFLVDAGVISEETLIQIEEVNKNHVPFYRVHEGGGSGLGSGSGFGTLWSPVKRFKGSGRDIIDPLESIMKNIYNYTALAQKQQVSTALLNMAGKPGVGDLFEQLLTPMKPQQFTVGEIEKDLKESVPGYGELLERLEEAGVDPSEELLAIFRPGDYHGKPNTISVLVEGKRKWFEVDAELYKSLEGLEVEQLDAWARWMATPARTLRAGATLAPEFLVRNPIRDQTMAYIQSEYGYKPYWDLGKGIFELVRKGEAYEDFMVSGATRGTLLGLDRDSQQRNLRRLVEDGGVKNVLKDPRTIVGVVGDVKRSLRSDIGPFMYVPYGQHLDAYPVAGVQGYTVPLNKQLVIRTAADPLSLAGAAMADVDPNLVPYDIMTMDARLADSAQEEEFWMQLLGSSPGWPWRWPSSASTG